MLRQKSKRQCSLLLMVLSSPLKNFTLVSTVIRLKRDSTSEVVTLSQATSLKPKPNLYNSHHNYCIVLSFHVLFYRCAPVVRLTP